MTTHLHTLGLLAGTLCCAALTACSDDVAQTLPGTDSLTSAYVLATAVTDGDKTANVLLTAPQLTSGTVSAVGNGLMNDGATEWAFAGSKYLYALTYNQGNAATTRSYVLQSDGQMRARAAEYKLSRFTTFGKYGSYIITASTGNGPSAQADAEGHLPKTLLLTWLDTEAETATANDTQRTDLYQAENFLGNGEYVTLCGFTESGGRLFSGVVGMGLSTYGSAVDGGAYIRPGYEDLLKTESGGSGSGAYVAGELQGTQYPDECHVAVFDNERLEGRRILTTHKISYPAGRYRSQYYQMVWAADNGDVYVFSPSYAKTLTDARQQTTLPAGVVRIKAGATAFDDTYYCNLEALSGGRSFLRCWPAGGSRFLLRMYDRPFSEAGYVANTLAVFDAEECRLSPVTGLPATADITDFGKTVHVEGEYVFIPVTTATGYPTLYAINTATGVATAGLTAETTTWTAIGKLQVNE